MLSTAQQMLQDSKTKIELLRMQIVKVTQAREGERETTQPEGEQAFLASEKGIITIIKVFTSESWKSLCPL